MRICVFCGSSPGRSDLYRDAAAELGQLLAAEEVGLGGVPRYSTEPFASIFRRIAREKRRHSGSMSRLFAGESGGKAA
jgi:hypothetical protein